MRAAVIIVTIVIWLWVAASILEFGATQDYAILNKFNVQLVAFLQSINTYLWWAVVLLVTLIIYFFLSSWYSGSVERAAYKAVPADTAAQLISSLSPEGRDVLGWVWRDRSEPINIGNLKTTKDELDNNRVSKLAQIREQERLLGASATVVADSRITTTPTRSPAPEKPAQVPTLQPEPVKPSPAPVAADTRPAAATAGTVSAAPKVTEPADAKPADQAKTEKAATSESKKPADTPKAASDVAERTQNEPTIPAESAKAQPTVSTSEQTEPTIGRSEATNVRPPRDEVKHTIT